MQNSVFLIALLFNFLVLFVILAIVPLRVVRDARSKGLSKTDQIIWAIISVGLFPIGLLLYLLVAKKQRGDSPQAT